MSNEDLSAFLLTRGKDGTINAIKWVAGWFSKNPDQTPIKFASGLDAGKAVSLYAGYIVSKNWVTPEVAFSMRTVIGSRYSDLDSAILADNGEDFLDEFKAVEADFNSLNKSKEDLDHLIGKDTARAISRMAKAGLSITSGSHISMESRVAIEDHIKHLQSLLKVTELAVVA